jgi:hypothetical protein
MPDAPTRDQRIQSSAHDRGLLANSAQFLRALEQLVVDVQRSPHAHEFGRSVHIRRLIAQSEKHVSSAIFSAAASRIAQPAP